jgi:signal peptidase I
MQGTHRTRRRRIAAVAVAACLVVAYLLLTPSSLGGTATWVRTSGTSMQPGIHAGDLVVARPRSTYQAGDIVAYRSKTLRGTVVLHRIVSVEADGFVTKGDNNDWLDPDRPRSEEILGELWIHSPGGGRVLGVFASPVALGLLALGLMATGGTVAHTRRTRRRMTVSHHVAGTRQRSRSMTGLPPRARQAAAAAGLVAVAGVALAAAAWTTPATAVLGTPQADSGPAMTFSYSAEVPKSAAYDDTTVTAPDPVFRKLTDTVEIEYSYRGDPGSIAVAAELSTSSGWHSTVPLGSTGAFSATSYTGSVSLDLSKLEKRSQAAAEATGIPATQLDIAVVPTVTTTGHKTFAPALSLALTPLQLTLTGDESTLTAGGSPATRADASDTPALSFAGRQLPVSTGRMISLIMVLGALLAAALIGLLARASAPATEAAAIHRRYAQMLVEVEPMPTPVGRPVVDVADFKTLAKLAERYQLLVLHWSRSDVATFVVQDHATTYRYRTGTGTGMGISHPSGRAVAEKA